MIDEDAGDDPVGRGMKPVYGGVPSVTAAEFVVRMRIFRSDEVRSFPGERSPARPSRRWRPPGRSCWRSCRRR